MTTSNNFGPIIPDEDMSALDEDESEYGGDEDDEDDFLAGELEEDDS